LIVSETHSRLMSDSVGMRLIAVIAKTVMTTA